MSKTKELHMKQWQDLLDLIFVHADGDDTVLKARAKHLKRVVGDVVANWAACDEAHTSYLDCHFVVDRLGTGPYKQKQLTDFS